MILSRFCRDKRTRDHFLCRASRKSCRVHVFIYSSPLRDAKKRENSEVVSRKFTSSLLRDVEKTHRRACFASTKAPANNVSSHFEGENRGREKSERDARSSGETGRVPLTGKAPDFAT